MKRSTGRYRARWRGRGCNSRRPATRMEHRYLRGPLTQLPDIGCWSMATRSPSGPMPTVHRSTSFSRSLKRCAENRGVRGCGEESQSYRQVLELRVIPCNGTETRRGLETGAMDESRMATLVGFEPTISTLKGSRAGPLHHRVGKAEVPSVASSRGCVFQEEEGAHLNSYVLLVTPGASRKPTTSSGGPGAAADLENLALVCAFHHRLVHEHGWGLTRDDDGELTWIRPEDLRSRAGPDAA